MMNSATLLALLFVVVSGAPKLRVFPEQKPAQLLTLPSNATSIRMDISDSFRCEGRDYGFYADVDNDCQIFHVCLPITYPDGHKQTFRWSFICPEETVFNQEIFTCTRMDESMDCSESPRFYRLNDNFGNSENDTDHRSTSTETHEIDQAASVSEVAQNLDKYDRRKYFEGGPKLY